MAIFHSKLLVHQRVTIESMVYYRSYYGQILLRSIFLFFAVAIYPVVPCDSAAGPGAHVAQRDAALQDGAP